ncbi:MAG: TlpA disulfide reductase family protein [Vicingaceae bacterium]
MKKHHILKYFMAFIIVGCSQSNEPNDSLLSGNVAASAGKMLILEHLTPQKVYAVDSTEVDDEGHFQFDLTINEPGFYRLKETEQKFVTLILQPDELAILNAEGDLGMSKYTLQGSPESENLKSINRKVGNFFRVRDSLSMVFKANEGNQEVLVQLQNEYNEAVEDNMRYMRDFVRMNPGSFACLAAAEQLNPESDYELYVLIDTELSKNYPNSSYLVEFHKVVESMRKLAVGTAAPDIILPNADGEMVSLSSLRGKVVLVDFWASWCKPCRMENPNVVKAYKKYNAKGFEVFGVSLDKERAAWLQAIEVDQLNWIQVSDLQFWNSSVVKLYDIKGIPFALLLDRDGKIIAKNLRGPALQNKLEEILQ